jgi:hypothetical protein
LGRQLLHGAHLLHSNIHKCALHVPFTSNLLAPLYTSRLIHSCRCRLLQQPLPPLLYPALLLPLLQ